MGKRIGLKGGPNYMVKDQQGQWKYPGQNTRIEGNDVTMKGVPYPVWAQPNVGPPTLMNPGEDYYFPNADYVDEFPMLGSTNPFNASIPKSNVESLQWQPEEAPDVSRFGFLFPEKNEGNIITGGGLNFNNSRTQFNATGVLPMNNNPVFKGVGSLGVRQQINDRLNLGVNLEAPLLRNPATGERIKQSPTAKFSLKYNFQNGGSLPRAQFGNQGDGSASLDWGQTMYVAGDPDSKDPAYRAELDEWANNLKSSLPNDYKDYNTDEIKELYDSGNVTATEAYEGEMIPSYQLPEIEITPQSQLPYWNQITDTQRELILEGNKPVDPAIIEKYGYNIFAPKHNPMLRSALGSANHGYGLINPTTGKKNDTYTQGVIDNMVKPGMAVAAIPLVAQALPHAAYLGSEAMTGLVNPILNTTIAGDITVGGALDAYGLYHGATHLPEDAQNMYNNPSWGNALNVGLDALGIGFGANAIGKQFIPTVKSGFTAPMSTKKPIINTINKTDDASTTLNQADTDWTNLPDNKGVDTEFWPGTYVPKKPQKVDAQPSTFYGNEKYNQSLTEANEQIARQNELIAEHNIKVNTGKTHKDPNIKKQFENQSTKPFINQKQALENVDDHIMPLIENFNNPAAKEKLINLGVKDPDDFIQYLMNEVQYTNVPGIGGYAGSSMGAVPGVDDLVNLGIGQHTERFAYVPNITSHTGDHEIGHLLQSYMQKRGLNLPERSYSIMSEKTGLPIKGISPRTVDKPITKFDEEASEFFRNFKKEDDWLATKEADNYAYTQKDYKNPANKLLPQDRYNILLKDLTEEAKYATKNVEQARKTGMSDKGIKSYFRDAETKQLWKDMVEHQELTSKKLAEFTKKYPDQTTYINQTTHQHEPLAHLRELRNELHQNGIIKNFQDPIDEKMLMEFWKSDAGKQNRILSFLQPSAEGKKGIINLVNRTPVVAGAVATGGLGVAVGSSGSNEEMQYGGSLPLYQSKGEVNSYLNKAASSEPATTKALEEMKLIQRMIEQRDNTIPQEMLVRQAFKESTFNPDAVSPAGYKGMTQLGDAVIKDYKKATGATEVDPFDAEDAAKVQKWYMDGLYGSSFINKPNQSNKVRRAKTFAAYNWGRGNMSNFLNAQKEKGVDIYNDDMKWLESLPTETKDYVNKIVLKNNEKFEKEYSNSKHDSISKTYYNSLFEFPKRQVGGEEKSDSVYVSQGEIGPRIASKFGITMQELLDANPGINPMMIDKGTSITIPGVGTPIQQPIVEEVVTPVAQPVVTPSVVTPSVQPAAPVTAPVVTPPVQQTVQKPIVKSKLQPVVNTQNKITSVNTPIEPVITQQQNKPVNPRAAIEAGTVGPVGTNEIETNEIGSIIKSGIAAGSGKLLPEIDFTQYEYNAAPSSTAVDIKFNNNIYESNPVMGDNTTVNINDTLTLGEQDLYNPNNLPAHENKREPDLLERMGNWIGDKVDNIHRGYVKHLDGDVYSTEEVDDNIDIFQEGKPEYKGLFGLQDEQSNLPDGVDGISGAAAPFKYTKYMDVNPEKIKPEPEPEPEKIKPSYMLHHKSVRDGNAGNLMLYQNVFDAQKGFNYVPIKNYGKSSYGTEYNNVKGIAHFLLDSDLTDGYKHDYAKNMIKQQWDGNPVAPASSVKDGYYPVYEKLDNGQVNIKYLKKDEIKDYESIASPLRQYKWSDLDWTGMTRAQGFQNTVASIPTVKSYTYKDKYDKVRTSNASHLIFPKAESRGQKGKYGRFGGSSVIFFVERPDGQREAIEMSGSINNIIEAGNQIMDKYKLKPEELIFGYHDVGSFSAKPEAQGGKLKFKQWSRYNQASNPWVGGGLAFPMESDTIKKFGGQINKNEVYKNYIKGKYDNTDKLAFGKEVYDKLNRLHYRDAKKSGMNIPNYVMTHVVGKGNK